MKSTPSLPGYQDVLAARDRVQNTIVKTPLLHNPQFVPLSAGQVWVKPECLQRTGSFKLRGAANRLKLLTSQERTRGVVAFSSGNHALAVSTAASNMGIRAGIVMPEDAPKSKIDGVRATGAHLLLFDRYTQDREAIAAQLAREWGAVVVPPYDDPGIIAGQGTVALEMAEHIMEEKSAFDAVFVGCSGGGLIAGCALVFRHLSPRTTIYAVEPAGFDDTGRSLAAGHRVSNANGGKTICDSLMASTPGESTFEINRRLLSGAITVTDEEVKNAMRVAFEQFRLVVEPGGAAALAGFLQGSIDCKSKVVGIVLSGGNVDRDLYAGVLACRTRT